MSSVSKEQMSTRYTKARESLSTFIGSRLYGGGSTHILQYENPGIGLPMFHIPPLCPLFCSLHGIMSDKEMGNERPHEDWKRVEHASRGIFAAAVLRACECAWSSSLPVDWISTGHACQSYDWLAEQYFFFRVPVSAWEFGLGSKVSLSRLPSNRSLFLCPGWIWSLHSTALHPFLPLSATVFIRSTLRHRVTQLRANGVHYREIVRAGLVVLKVAWLKSGIFSGNRMELFLPPHTARMVHILHNLHVDSFCGITDITPIAGPTSLTILLHRGCINYLTTYGG